MVFPGPRKAKISTTGICRIFRVLKFELDTEIEENSIFRSGTKYWFLLTPQGFVKVL